MATNKVENKDAPFTKGSSSPANLSLIFGDTIAVTKPEELIYELDQGASKSGLALGVVGNDDFPAGQSMNFTDAPTISNFAPDIRSPGDGITEHPEAGQFGEEVAADLVAIPDEVKILIGEHADGTNGDTTSPHATSAKISEQTIGSLLTLPGQSYPDSGN